jgi:hypothetical protein
MRRFKSPSRDPFNKLALELLRLWSVDRANVCTCSAFYAYICVNNVLAVAGRYAGNRAFSLASSTAYAFIIYKICHRIHLLKINKLNYP